MKIGIFSDTHKRVGRSLRVINKLIDEGAEYLIHAGDIVKPEVLEQLTLTNLPYVAVLGNNDAHLQTYAKDFNIVQEPYYFKIKSTTFKLMHLPFYMSPDSDVVISGHTHIFDVKKTQKTLFINPGEACARDKNISECALLEVTEAKYKLNYFYRKVKTDKWENRNYDFPLKKSS